MRHRFALSAIFLLLAASCVMYVPEERRTYPPSRPYDQPVRYAGAGISVGYFYDYLGPYGNWINFRPYGYVWCPRGLGYRWHPYSRGHWVWSDFGWMWISDYSWGWVPFHYGRWGWDDDIGWFWVPDTIWGPAWVSWRWGGPYMGWAPMPPAGFYGPDIPYHFWCFVDGRYFLEPRLDIHVLPFERNRTILTITQLRAPAGERGGRVFNAGPDLDVVRQLTRRTVTRVDVRDAARPGPTEVRGGAVVIYKPEVKRDESARPRVVRDRDEAAEELSRAKIFDSRTARPEEGTSVIRRRAEEEKRLLENSQKEDENRIRRRFEEQEKTTRSVTEKSKVRQDMEKEMAETRKRHAEEKKELEQRQKSDEEKVKGRVIKKVEKKK